MEEALGFLAADDPLTRPIGGGTALMLMMKAQLFAPTRLVSLRKLGGPLQGFRLEENGDLLRVGAMTTFATLEHSPEIHRLFPVVREVMKTLANVRVRNVATVGGNLAHGDPHLDLPPVWAALDARIVILGPTGQRLVQVEDFYTGYYETRLKRGEIIVELLVPVRRSWRSVYVKVTTRSVHDWPALGIAISAEIEGDHIRDIRAVLGAATDRPTRLAAAESILRGARLDEERLSAAAEAAADGVQIESDARGSTQYKAQLLRVHFGRALRTLMEK